MKNLTIITCREKFSQTFLMVTYQQQQQNKKQNKNKNKNKNKTKNKQTNKQKTISQFLYS